MTEKCPHEHQALLEIESACRTGNLGVVMITVEAALKNFSPVGHNPKSVPFVELFSLFTTAWDARAVLDPILNYSALSPMQLHCWMRFGKALSELNEKYKDPHAHPRT